MRKPFFSWECVNDPKSFTMLSWESENGEYSHLTSVFSMHSTCCLGRVRTAFWSTNFRYIMVEWFAVHSGPKSRFCPEYELLLRSLRSLRSNKSLMSMSNTLYVKQTSNSLQNTVLRGTRAQLKRSTFKFKYYILPPFLKMYNAVFSLGSFTKVTAFT